MIEDGRCNTQRWYRPTRSGRLRQAVRRGNVGYILSTRSQRITSSKLMAAAAT
jgi:hypothetical protein